ncbi:hypothetical protein SAMN05660199_04567 [Klenkia soli]|uniref:Uncharacterized protein n=1 Tax=Klenkia soli TaxID=1052260 RepID=A0A1H0UMJ0_9ACTN|nr:DUF6518 family protein [Klenkia soli]SDP67285.1 hypothetical protein SAMN05660199_04567 [Klenkia soli]
MTSTATPPTTTAAPWVRAGAALVAAAVLGAVTAAAQGWLPQQLAPLANSAGAWTLITAAAVGWSRVRPLPAAVLGAGAYLALNVGYALLSATRGLSYPIDPHNRWVAIGFVAGPLVGLGASWLRHRRDVLAALGVAGLAGVLVGEAWYGLTVLDPSPSALYWTSSAAGGCALLAWGVRTRLDGLPARAVAVAGSAVVTLGIPVTLALVGGVPWPG